MSVRVQNGGIDLAIGRWPPIHCHVLTLLVPVLLTFPLWRRFSERGLETAAVVILGAVASMLAHELGHALAAARYGATGARIRLTMLGGHVSWNDAPLTAGQRRIVTLSGPLANLLVGICLLAVHAVMVKTAPGLMPAPADIDVFSRPPPQLRSIWLQAAEWLGWINIALACLNLMPAYPLDGGELMQDWIESRFGAQRARFWVGLSGTMLSIAATAVSLAAVLSGFLILLPPAFAPNWAALTSSRRGSEK